jgi:hypothetical protein
MFHKGQFHPTNINKYSGNPKKIFFRSSLEKRLMLLFDKNPIFEKWSSEEKNCIVGYRGIDGKAHRYFIDFYIKLYNGKEYLIEVKPLKKTKVPRKNSKNYLYESAEFIRNQLKFEAGKKHAKKLGMEYVIITDKTIKTELSDKKLMENLQKVVPF